MVHHFHPETKQQSKHWKHLGFPPPKETKSGMSVGKVMASSFWDAEGVLLVDHLDKGHTITGAYYADLLKQLREKIKQIQADKRSALPPGQCSGTNVHNGHGCYPEMWISTCRRPTLFL